MGVVKMREGRGLRVFFCEGDVKVGKMVQHLFKICF